jgi:hypothetical protein
MQDNENPKNLSEWGSVGRNHLLIFNMPKSTNEYGAAIVVSEEITGFRRQMDHELLLDVGPPSSSEWMRLPNLLPYDIKVSLHLWSYTKVNLMF